MTSNYDEIDDFYKLLDSFINTHKATTNETKIRKNKILSYVKPLYNKYFNAYEKDYNSEKIEVEEKRGLDYKQFEIINNGDQAPKSTKKEDTETKKPSCVKINKSDFNLLVQDINNNLNNDEFKIAVDKKTYNLKNARIFGKYI